MFDAPFAARRRPMFGVSAALHGALALALAVPPLLATQEPPEPEVRMVPLVPFDSVQIGGASAQEAQKRDLLRKGNRGDAPPAARRATNAPAPRRAALVQPTEILPAPTGGEPESPFAETGGRSEPEGGGGIGEPGTGDDGDGCSGCKAISATAPGVTPPVPLETISPAYPEPARRAHIEGVVVVAAVIGADGFVRDASIFRSASPLLDPAALEAVRRWRYRPARIGERFVSVYLNVVVTFSLRNL